MMKKHIGLVCGAVLFALLAAGCSGAFGFDGKEDGGLGDDSNKENPFKGTTWEDSEKGITLSFEENTCTYASSTARALSVSYSYVCKNNGGKYTATLTEPGSDLEWATFTINASDASSGILTTSDGDYPLTKKTGSGGSSSGGSETGDGSGSNEGDVGYPFANTKWTNVSGTHTMNFGETTVTYHYVEYAYTSQKNNDGSYTATLTWKADPSQKYGSFEIGTPHAPYGVYDDGSVFFKDVKQEAISNFQIEGSKLVKYVGKQENVTIPSSVKWIGDEAFKGCDFIEYVKIPLSVESIGKDAFAGCSSLKRVLYPGTSNRWKRMLFYYDQQGETIGDATGLKGKTIVSTADGMSFGYSTAVSYWKSTYANSNTVGMQIETYTGADENLTIPVGATQIRANAFDTYNHTDGYIISVTIPNTVTDIGEQAFRNRKKLETVVISGTMASIGESAFYGCELLKNVTISEGVASIKNNAFQGCSSLASISIPGSVTDTGTNIFAECTSLTEVKICEGMTKLGDRLFENCATIQNVTMPESMTSIGAWTFSKCSGLESVTIPANVTSIGQRAFGECTGLTSVSIPDGVTSIEDQTFYGCSNLESVTIGNGVESIGVWAFYGCTKLTSVEIPDSVISIGKGAFYNCSNLESVTIPNSVTNIGQGVFSGCDNLATVKYDGTKEQWDAIEFTTGGPGLDGKTITGKDADGNDTTWTVN